MKKVTVLVGLIVLTVVPAFAQEYPKAEIFGGFSLLNTDLDGERENGYGWQTSIAGNFHKNVGFVADFGGQYGKFFFIPWSTYEIGFGPRFYVRGDKTTGFVHALFGAYHARALGESETDFGMSFGGGMDVNVTNRVAVRVVQFDWFIYRAEDLWRKKDIRLGFGVVFKAGGR